MCMKGRVQRYMIALGAAGALGVSSIVLPAGAAEKYPEKPISWIVPYGPGGGTDIVARLLTNKITQSINQSIVVENRPGGNTMIGTQALLKARPDGYTVMQTAEQIAANESLYKDLKFKVSKDFSYVAPLVRTPLVLVARKDLPASTPQELFVYMKNKGSAVNYGSWGQGGMNHLTMEAFASRIGAQPTHVPFNGAAAAIKELVAGNIDLYFSDYGTAMSYVETGRIKPILVSSKERLPMLPNVPTIHESGFENFDMYSFQGVVMPEGAPKDAIESLSIQIQKALQDKEVREALMARGFLPNPGTPEDFQAQVLRAQSDFAKIIQERGIRLE